MVGAPAGGERAITCEVDPLRQTDRTAPLYPLVEVDVRVMVCAHAVHRAGEIAAQPGVGGWRPSLSSGGDLYGTGTADGFTMGQATGAA